MRVVIAISGAAILLGGCAGTDRTQTESVASENDQVAETLAFNVAHTAVIRVDGMT